MVKLFEAREVLDVPMLFFATTVNVYARPLTRPSTTHECVGTPERGTLFVQVLVASSIDVTTYEETAEPLSVEDSHVTVTR